MPGAWIKTWGAVIQASGPVIQASGAVIAATVIAYGAYNAAGRFDPKFVRVRDHMINIEHIVEVARMGAHNRCKIYTSISASRILDSPDGGPSTQDIAGHDIDGTACDELHEKLNNYALDVNPLLVPRSPR